VTDDATVNPDGPEAAARIAELEAALREVAVLGHGRCKIGKPLADMIRAALGGKGNE
jgi:hypothetical protein